MYVEHARRDAERELGVHERDRDRQHGASDDHDALAWPCRHGGGIPAS
jgi:hypothetical protein